MGCVVLYGGCQAERRSKDNWRWWSGWTPFWVKRGAVPPNKAGGSREAEASRGAYGAGSPREGCVEGKGQMIDNPMLGLG